jgi:hypothetical protein
MGYAFFSTVPAKYFSLEINFGRANFLFTPKYETIQTGLEKILKEYWEGVALSQDFWLSSTTNKKTAYSPKVVSLYKKISPVGQFINDDFYMHDVAPPLRTQIKQLFVTNGMDI